MFAKFLDDLFKFQIIDEKSLIKKYQHEIRSLKEELEQLKRGIVTVPRLKDIVEDDIVLLKQKVDLYRVLLSPDDSIIQLVTERFNFCLMLDLSGSVYYCSFYSMHHCLFYRVLNCCHLLSLN